MAERFSDIHRVERSAYKTSDAILIEKIILDSSFRLHWHDHFEVEYFLSGCGTHLCNGKVSKIVPGTCHFILPTDIHALYAEEPMELIKIVFDESNIDPSVCGALEGILPDACFCFEGKERHLLEALFCLCAEEKANFSSAEQYSPVAKRLLETILLHLVAYCQENSLYNSDCRVGSDTISNALAYLHRNFRNPITLAEVADYVHFSPSYLSTYFKKAVGVAFKEYLLTLRLRFAAKLLRSSDCPVTELCYESGFGSLSNFINAFHAAYGMSPSVYRKTQLITAVKNRESTM